MTLLDMQRVFSRILTDTEFQTAFFAGDPGASAPYNLDSTELRSLLGLHRHRLELHTRNLAHTRLEHALMAMPRSAGLIGSSLRQHVTEFCAAWPPLPRPETTLLTESDRLAQFAGPLFAAGVLRPGYAEDVLQYEYTMLRVGFGAAAATSAEHNAELPGPESINLETARPLTGPHAIVRTFRFDIIDLLVALDRDEPPATATPTGTPLRMLFIKRPGSTEVRTARVNKATTTLLSHCTGALSTRDLLFELAEADAEVSLTDLARLEADIHVLLRQLHRLGAIGFLPPSGTRTDDSDFEGTP